MKKLNNKGFAISTLLYGLLLVAFLVISLLMSIMSTNRKNTSTLIKKIEEELNRYSQTATELTSTDGAQEFIVPYGKAGWYKIELWGAAAYEVDATKETSDKRGAYTSGIIYLEENEHLYFFIGTLGTTSSTATKNNIDSTYAGGATDVRLEGGVWNNSSGLNSRIMVAAGGGYDFTKPGSGFGGHYTQNNDGGSYISGNAGQTTYDGYTFLNPIIYSGVNAGVGKAKIELISSAGKDTPPAERVNNLRSIRAVRDCITTTETNKKSHWSEIQVFDKTGKNIVKGATAKFGTKNAEVLYSVDNITDGDLSTNGDGLSSISSSDQERCIEVDWGSYKDVEEIAIFHNLSSGTTRKYKTGEISVLTSSNNWVSIRAWSKEKRSPEETYKGIRISDRRYFTLEKNTIPTGNYYIQSSLSDNRLVSIVSGVGQLSLFSGEKTQKWNISHVGNGNYKILDAANQMALQPQDGGLEVGEYINNATKYNNHEWERWTIASDIGNGYYIFKAGGGNNLCMTTSSTNRDSSGLLQLKTCNDDDRSQWFKIVNADY